MTPRETENKHTFVAIAGECLKIESDLQKLRVHLYAVGLATIASTLGDISDRVRQAGNWAVPENIHSHEGR